MVDTMYTNISCSLLVLFLTQRNRSLQLNFSNGILFCKDASTLQEMLDSVCGENIPARGLSLPNKAHKDTEDLISLRTSSKNSRALVVLREVILDPSWITTFNVYFRFR